MMSSDLKAVLSKRRALESGAIWATAIPFSTLNGSSADANEEDVKVFLGSGRDASNLSKLKEHGVKRILNVADDIPNYHEDEGFTYCRLEVADFGGEALKGNDGIQALFGLAADFVRGTAHTTYMINMAELNTKGPSNILIHCANGSNRSVTITLALMMIIDDCDLRTAWDTVKSRRTSAMPLKDNRLALLDFEKKQRGNNSMDEDDFFRKSVTES
eukprot:286647_1